jgi:hypothetical protein
LDERGIAPSEKYWHGAGVCIDRVLGKRQNLTLNFKHLRKTAHTHHPVDDVKGNAEAFLHMKTVMGLDVDF